MAGRRWKGAKAVEGLLGGGKESNLEIEPNKYKGGTKGESREGQSCIIMQFRFSFTILVLALLKTRVGVSASSSPPF